MSDVVALTVVDRQQHTTLLVAFGGLAMLIASIGLYGLLAQSVSARSREIGLRIALGATWRSVVTLVMSRWIVLTGTGVALGVFVAWMVTRAMQTLLFGVDAGDPLTFAVGLGLLATWPSSLARFRPSVRRVWIRCWPYATSRFAHFGGGGFLTAESQCSCTRPLSTRTMSNQ